MSPEELLGYDPSQDKTDTSQDKSIDLTKHSQTIHEALNAPTDAVLDAPTDTAHDDDSNIDYGINEDDPEMWRAETIASLDPAEHGITNLARLIENIIEHLNSSTPVADDIIVHDQAPTSHAPMVAAPTPDPTTSSTWNTVAARRRQRKRQKDKKKKKKKRHQSICNALSPRSFTQTASSSSSSPSSSSTSTESHNHDPPPDSHHRSASSPLPTPDFRKAKSD